VVRLGIADHLGWAVAVSASDDHAVLDDAGTAELVAEVRAAARITASRSRQRWSQADSGSGRRSPFRANPFRARGRTADDRASAREGFEMVGVSVNAPRWRSALAGVVAAVVVVAALAASTVRANAADAVVRPRTATRISTVDNPKLGRILVAGTTVYALTASTTPCRAACLKAWTPVLLPHGVKAPTAGAGVDRSKLATAAAATRGRQITYSGKRLYWFAHDTARGQVHGNMRNRWGTWSAVVVTATAPATDAPATAPPTDAPTTAPPATDAPATAPPAAAPPATEAPATAPPTEPPTTRPPSTTTPGTGGVAF
jgi:predicted lipoprotein with Yx(FWY)xxD motif